MILTIVMIKTIMKYCRLAVYLTHLIIIANNIKSISKDIVALIVHILSILFLTILIHFVIHNILVAFIKFILLLTQTKRNRWTIRRFLWTYQSIITTILLLLSLLILITHHHHWLHHRLQTVNVIVVVVGLNVSLIL